MRTAGSEGRSEASTSASAEVRRAEFVELLMNPELAKHWTPQTFSYISAAKRVLRAKSAPSYVAPNSVIGKNVILTYVCRIDLTLKSVEGRFWYHIVAIVCAKYIPDPLRLGAPVHGTLLYRVTTIRYASVGNAFAFCR